jgi:Cu2+-exporting ATPase
LVCVDGRVEGWVWLDDPLRPEAIEAVRRLRAMGYRVVIATGDSSSKAESVARALGVEVRKGLSPEDKAELVRELGKVAFVGDGINDALALKEAFVGVAVSSGTDLAKVAGDVMIPSIGALPGLLEGSRRTVRKVKENVAWALVYNSVLIPIASGVLYPFYLPPEWAALAMSMNSVSVVLWSLIQ